MSYHRNIHASRILIATLADGICLSIAFLLTWFVWAPPLPGTDFVLLMFASIAACWAGLFFNDGYQPETLGDGRKTVAAILATMGMGLVVAAVAYFGVSVPRGVTPTLMCVAGLFFPLMVAGRLTLRLLLGSRLLTVNIVVIGATDLGHEIGMLLHRQSETGLRMIGFLSDDAALHRHGARFEGFPVIGRVDQLEKVLADTRVDCIVVASKDRNESFPAATLMLAKMHGVRVESGVSFLERQSGRVYMRDLRPSYLIFGSGFRPRRSSAAIQRVIDVVGASLLFVVALPALLLAALAIKLETPGPVVIRQCRLGKNDKPFMMLKLRSMKDDAESMSGPVFASEKDERITTVGYFLRRTRLDEFPQLWNVLRGEMALVGPRAERPEFVELLSERYRYYNLRTSVRPGVTGWAQVRFGYVNDIDNYEEKLAFDLYYLKNRSLFLDQLILAQTVKTVLRFGGM